MISTDAATLALSIAQGLIKLGGRIDLLLAERSAVSGEFLVPVPPVASGPSMPAIRKELRAYLDDTADDNPDPLGSDRKRLARLLDQSPSPDELGDFYLRLFPSKASPAPVDPDAAYLRELRTRMPGLDWADPAVRQAAFFIAAGRDAREIGYPLRLGLLVADTLAEVASQNTARMIRDPRLAEGVQAVLERFAQPDLESFTEWSPLLQHVLRSTLNGLLDARGVVAGHNPWLDAVLTALARAREDSEDGDDYLAGLMEGRGYGLLVSEGLSMAAGRLDETGAPVFQQIASEVLAAAAPLVRDNKRGFAGFFNEHWSDLLHGALVALDKHGPQLLEGEDPLLQEVLTGLIRELASTSGAAWFTRDMVLHLADAAVGVVATHEALWKPTLQQPWLQELVSSAVGVVSTGGIRRAFSTAGLEDLATSVLARFASNPRLLVANPGLPFELVSAVLKAVAEAGPLDAHTLATAAIPAALEVLEQHAGLVGEDLAPVVAGVCAEAASRVASGHLDGAAAAALVCAALKAVALNPEFLVKEEGDLVAAVCAAVCDASSGAAQGVLSGSLLVDAAGRILTVLARHGRVWMEEQGLKPLVSTVSDLLTRGLGRAVQDLGRGLVVSDFPALLAGLLEAVFLGGVDVSPPKGTAFDELYTRLLKSLVTP
jgi:hypothetical protein